MALSSNVAPGELSDPGDLDATKHYERIYHLLQQSKQGRLDRVREKAYNAKSSPTPTMLFVSVLVHNGMHPDKAESVALVICKTLRLGTIDHFQRCKAEVLRSVLAQGTESRWAFHNFMLALSIASENGVWDDDQVDSKDQKIWPPRSGLTRLRGLRLVANILRSVLKEVPAEITPHNDHTLEDDSPLAIACMLQRLIMQLVALATCSGGLGPEDHRNQLYKFVEYCAMHCSRVFTKADLRTLDDIIAYPDHRKPAQLNEEELDNANSGYRAALSGESVVPERHGLASNRNAPWHQLPAANGMRQQRERSFGIVARALPPGGYPLEDAGKPWDDETKQATRNLMNEMLHQFDPIDAQDIQDIDDLGNIVWKDPGRPTRNHWGFSEEGLAAMKTNKTEEKEKRKKKAGQHDDFERPRAIRTNDIERARELAARGRGGGGGGDYGYSGGDYGYSGGGHGGYSGRGGRGRGGYRGGRGY